MRPNDPIFGVLCLTTWTIPLPRPRHSLRTSGLCAAVLASMSSSEHYNPPRATSRSGGKFAVDVRVKFLQDLPRVPVDLRAGVKAAGPVRGFRYKSGDGVLVSYHGSLCSAESTAAIRTLELRRPVMPWPPLLGHRSRRRHLWLSSHQPGNGPGLEFERLRP